MPARTSSQTWLVTGASQGLGLCVALSALNAGHKVLACARNVETARKAHPEVEANGGKWLKLDVSSPETTEIVQKADADAGGIDVVINNAGYFQGGTIEDLTEQEMLASISTNFLGPIRVLKGVLASMRERRGGTIVANSSIFGLVPCPGGAMYNCTKAAEDVLHETLKVELTAFGIRTITLLPGLFRTNITTNASMPTNGFNQSYVETPAVGGGLGIIGGWIADPEKNMPGDPRKFGQRVVELVDGTGYGEDLEKHSKVFMGRDALELAQKKVQMLSGVIEASKRLAVSTDFDGHEGPGVVPITQF